MSLNQHYNAEKALFQADRVRLIKRLDAIVDELDRSQRVTERRSHDLGTLYTVNFSVWDDQAVEYLKHKLQGFYENMHGHYPVAFSAVYLDVQHKVTDRSMYKWYETASDGDGLEIKSEKIEDSVIMARIELWFNSALQEDAPEDAPEQDEPTEIILETEATQEATQIKKRGAGYAVAELRGSKLRYKHYNANEEHMADCTLDISELAHNLQVCSSIGTFMLIGKGAPHYMSQIRKIVESLDVRYIKAPNVIQAYKIMRGE